MIDFILENDGKCKHDSYSCKVELTDSDHNYFFSSQLESYGGNIKESLKNMNKCIDRLSEEILELKLRIKKEISLINSD